MTSSKDPSGKFDNQTQQLATPNELKLLDEALAIAEEDAKQAGTLGYMAQVLAQVTLPHSKPKSNEYTRRNGNLSISIVAPEHPGLPYGTVPRLLISWLVTEAVRTKERRLILGDTLTDFMQDLALGRATGGAQGSITRLRNQTARLFSSTVHCIYDGPVGKASHFRNRKLDIVEDSSIWWSPQDPDQAGLWQSEVLLSKTFFDQVTERPVPIDKRALKALKRSPMAMDLYIWLTYRMSYLPHPTTVAWEALAMQFGSGYADTPQGRQGFRRTLEHHLKKVLVVYPEARVKAEKSGLSLLPSPTHISKLK